MKRINDKFRIFDNADETFLSELSDKYTKLTEKETKRIFKASEQKAIRRGALKENAGEIRYYNDAHDSLNIIPVTNKRSWESLLGAAAACLVIAAAAVLGVSYFSDITEIDPIGANIVITNTPDNVDSDTSMSEYSSLNMDSKENIFHKVLNSVDYYNYANGRIITNSLNGSEYIIEYKLNMEEDTIAYEHIYSLSDKYERKTFVDNGKIMSAYIQLDENEIKFDETAAAYSKSHDSGDYEDDGKRIISDLGDTAEYIYRLDPTNISWASKTSLFPQEVAFRFLSDINKWDIVGSEDYLDRDCVVIKGSKPGENDIDFKIIIDKNTGIILFNESYDSSGDVIEYTRTTKFSVNKETIYIPENTKDIKFSAGSEHEQIDSLMISQIAGTWYLESSLWNDRLKIDNNGNFICECDGGHTVTGTVHIEPGELSDGSEAWFFNFYTDDNLLWNSFPVRGNMNESDLAHESQKESYYRRESLIIDNYEESGEISSYFSSLAGEYYNERSYGKITSIVITPDGKFTAYGTEDGGISGTLRLISEKNEDGTDDLYCTLVFDENQETYIKFPVNDILNMSDGLGAYKFKREDISDDK